MRHLKTNFFFLLTFLVALAFQSCEEKINISADDQKVLDDAKATKASKLEDSKAKGEIYSFMKDYYLWYDKIPTMDTAGVEDPETFYYSMLYRSLDNWSFIVTQSQYDDMMNARYYGHGFGIALDSQGDIRISYVFNTTQSYNKGIRRGWKILTVNGTEPKSFGHLDELLGDDTQKSSNTIRFEKPDGSITSVSLTKEEVQMNTVLNYRTFAKNSGNIGYIAVQGFMGDSASVVNEYAEAFRNFNNNSIKELIIDLRYNSGGQGFYAELMGNLILGNFKSGNTFSNIVFNNRVNDYLQTQMETKSTIESNTNSLQNALSRVFFLTGPETASASELLISCLQPYVATHLIGERTTGKRVGMFTIPLEKSNNILVPIMFEWENSRNEMIKYTGIPVEKIEADDLLHELGDEQEACLSQALNYIQNGTFMNMKKSAVETDRSKMNAKGYRAYINAY